MCRDMYVWCQVVKRFIGLNYPWITRESVYFSGLPLIASNVTVFSLSGLRDFLTAEDKEGVFNADHFPLWYKRAAEQVPGTFVYSLPFNTGQWSKDLTSNKVKERPVNSEKNCTMFLYWLRWKPAMCDIFMLVLLRFCCLVFFSN